MGDAGHAAGELRLRAAWAVRADCGYAEEFRESRERAREYLTRAKIRWHGLRVPPFTAR